MITEPIFLGVFEDELDIIEQFGINPADFEGVHVIFADYEPEEGEGEAFVLYEEQGTLFEVCALHCECDGLIGQWSPEETDFSALMFRVEQSEVLSTYASHIETMLKELKV